MQQSTETKTRLDTVISLRADKEALLRNGMELTRNHKGCTYHLSGEPERHWISSLPKSDLPLLDAGACYGVQTIQALNSGRDVIALDMCEEHINVLLERVSKLHDPGVGTLIRSIIKQVPDPDVVDDASVSGILCSEVIHFLKPGQMRPLFKDFFKWLAPGGKLIVTVGAWPNWIEHYEKQGFTFWKGRSAKEVLELKRTLSPSELVDATPGMAFCPDKGPWKDLLGDTVYAMSTVELQELAESSGFVVQEVRYFDRDHAGRHGHEKSLEPENALLVARKPVNLNLSTRPQKA